MRGSATYYTVSNDVFFPGTVALLNSLRLTGNVGELVILDHGLTPTEKRLVEEHATIVELPVEFRTHPALAKPYVHLLNPNGIVVFIDSDMIVTRGLDRILALADRGKICLFPDHWTARDRWFREWEQLFGLSSPPRRQTYMNSGFLAFSTSDWPHLLDRWWQACARIAPDRVFVRENDPLFAGDQDALNAVLMSEVPRNAVALLDPDEAVFRELTVCPDALMRAQVTRQHLVCTYRGRRTTLLHYAMRPKAWDPEAWSQIHDDAYVRLMPRVLFGSDVPLRLRSDQAPLWLRPDLQGRLCAHALSQANYLRSLTTRASRALGRRLLGLPR